jgi:hypothetical protein
MEPEVSLPCSQEPSTGPYTEPDQSNPCNKTDQTNDSEKGTWTLGNKNRQLWGHSSKYMAHCKIPPKVGSTKGTNCYSWSLGLKFLPIGRANAIADCLEIQFAPHDLCDEDHERRVEARVQALLEAVDNKPLSKNTTKWLTKLNKLKLKLRKACGINSIPNECLRHFARRPLVHLTHLINNCIRLSHFPKSWKEAKVITLLKPGKDPKSTQNFVLLAYRPRRASCLKKLF